MARKYLSKSTFIKGTQCQKALYLHKFHSELADEISIQGGIRVWNGEGFQIENPPQLNGANMIMITNTELKVKK